MKALLLSLLLVIGLDEAFDEGAGVRACVGLVLHLARGTHSEVSESVYRS